MTRRLPVLFAAVLITSTAFAQYRGTVTSRFGSSSGFGSVLFPGTGHAPIPRPPGAITDTTFSGRFGATIRGGTPYRGIGGGMIGGAVRGGYPMMVPVPVFVGGGGYYPYDPSMMGYYPQAMPMQPMMQPMMQPQAQPPVVIINQGYQPQTANPVVRAYPQEGEGSGPTSYTAPVHPMPDPAEQRERDREREREKDQARPAKRVKVEDEKPTIYLIAFKDHTILPALAYWMEGDTLNYITTQGTPNRASITLVDREFSRQLNHERQVEFSLP